MLLCVKNSFNMQTNKTIRMKQCDYRDPLDQECTEIEKIQWQLTQGGKVPKFFFYNFNWIVIEWLKNKIFKHLNNKQDVILFMIIGDVYQFIIHCLIH